MKRIALVLVVLFLLPLAVMADPAVPLPTVVEAPPAAGSVDWTAVAVSWIAGFQLLALPFIVLGVRKVIPKIPRIYIPFVAMTLGVGLDALSQVVMGGGFSPFRGAILGFLSVAVREVFNTFREHGGSA